MSHKHSFTKLAYKISFKGKKEDVYLCDTLGCKHEKRVETQEKEKEPSLAVQVSEVSR